MTTVTTNQVDATAGGGPLLTRRIEGKLRGLRRALRGRLLAEGAAWLVVASVALVLVTLALDYLLRLERPQRVLVMAVALAGVAWVAWRQVIRPVRVAMGQVELALLIERRYPHLQSRLISAIQFGWAHGGDGASAAMISRMADEANEIAGELDFTPVVERASMWRTVKIALCAACLLAGLAVWQGTLLDLWAKRNLAFLEVPWPQKTYLKVQGEDFAVLRGDDLTVEVTVEPGSVAPQYVTIHARYLSVGRTEDRVEATAGDARRFEIVFRAVSEPFEFYVVGGDDRRDRQRPHEVALVDAPALRKVTFTVKYPPYMRRQSVAVDGIGGEVVVSVGGFLGIEAVATKNIEPPSVSLTGAEGEVSVTLRIEQPEGADPGEAITSGRGPWLGSLEITGANEPEVRTLQFHLTDTQGYGNRHGGRYFLRVQPDLAPGVSIRKTDVGTDITPNAVIPLLIHAKDDSGIVLGQVRLSSSRETTPNQAEAIDIQPGRAGLKEFTIRHELDLDGRGMLPGDTIAIFAEVTDILPPDLGGPNAGTSGTITFRIVQPDELLDELVMRQKTLRLEFLQALAQQESARARTIAAADELAEQSAITPDVLRRLADSAGQQRSVGTEVARAAQMLAAIRTEMIYNRLGEAADLQDLQTGIIEPLRDIYEDGENVAAELAAAAELSDAGAMQASARRIAEDQRDLSLRMAEILERMEKLQSRQDLANKLQTVIRWAEQALEGIRRQEQEEVRGIWNP